MSHTTEVMAFLWYFCLLWQNVVAVAKNLAIRTVFFSLADHENPTL